MKALHTDIDPDGLLEFSVVYTDRSLNHMSNRFQDVMTDISGMLKSVYKADHVAIVPGGGTFAMEAVARAFGADADVMILRNGWFSYRWTQIFEACKIAKSETVLKAAKITDAPEAPFAPAKIEHVEAEIAAKKPAVVFAPHVETSAGMMLPDDYIARVSEAVHAVGGVFVLDCIASGCAWVDMAALGVDVLISAPQKGWSASPCAGLVMLNDRAKERALAGTGSSFAGDLKTWIGIMEAYENGGHAYHATMPTDGLTRFRDIMVEAKDVGFERLREAQFTLGARVRGSLAQRGIASVAADGFAAPGVVVSYTDDPEVKTGAKFAALGMQIAAGVPLKCDEPADYSSFRIGLFGMDKLLDVERAVGALNTAFDQVFDT